MKILAVETSSEIAAVAVMEDERPLGEYILNCGKVHSVKLMPLIRRLLSDLDLTAEDIDYYAISSGPGSFTGLRIGFSTVRAMAYASGKKVVIVPSLDIIARNGYLFDGIVCPMIDARNNQVYSALYNNFEGDMSICGKYFAGDINELLNIVSERAERVIFAGNAAPLHYGIIKKAVGERAFFVEELLNYPKASVLASLAYKKVLKGEFMEACEALPFYLRRSSAEQKKGTNPEE